MARKLQSAGKDGVTKLPSKKLLQDLLALDRNVRERVSSAGGELGKKIADAAAEHNLHPGAFRICAKVSRMDPVKMRSFLDNFDAYRDMLELDKKKATDMFAGREDDDDDGETETAPPPANGKRGAAKKASKSVRAAADLAEASSKARADEQALKSVGRGTPRVSRSAFEKAQASGASVDEIARKAGATPPSGGEAAEETKH